MRTDSATLERALGLFAEHPGLGICLTGAAVDIGFNLRFADPAAFPSAPQLFRRFQFISQDLWNIVTIADRLEWMRTRAREDQDFTVRWGDYAALDIQSLHVEIRSLLDHVAGVVRLFAPKPGQVPNRDSFRKLLNWAPGNLERLQQPITELLRDQSSWFHEFRSVRDQLVHLGGFTIVFGGPNDGILFQVMDARFEHLIGKPFLMYNENVAYFDRYAALYVSRLITFLDDIATFYMSQLNVVNAGGLVRATGYRTVRSWISSLLHVIQAQ